MDNATVFEDLHFQIGDGNLNYYMYNWIMKCKKIQPQELGVVLFWWNKGDYEMMIDICYIVYLLRGGNKVLK